MSRYIQNWSWKRKIGVPLLIIIAILGTVGRGPFLSMVSYTTAYEGAKAQFVGVVYNNRFYTKTNTFGASACRFDSTMNFDPDQSTLLMPNIIGEMTSVYIPVREAIPPDWVPSSWWRDYQYIVNPIEEWSWTIKDADGFSHTYEMEHWVTKWYVSYEAVAGSGPSYLDDLDEAQNRFYSDVQTWIEFDISPVWQFEGQDMAYFAIGKIELENVKIGGIDKLGRDAAVRPGVDFTPESVGSILTIYTSLTSTESYDIDDLTTYAYRGTKLNPQYFRDKVYIHIDLNNFGVKETGNIFDPQSTGDVVTLGFAVHQFVVGEWIQRDITQPPIDYGRDPQVIDTWGLLTPVANFLGALGGFLGSPGGGLTMILFIMLLVVAAGIYFGFIPIPGLGRRRGE